MLIPPLIFRFSLKFFAKILWLLRFIGEYKKTILEKSKFTAVIYTETKKAKTTGKWRDGFFYKYLQILLFCLAEDQATFFEIIQNNAVAIIYISGKDFFGQFIQHFLL